MRDRCVVGNANSLPTIAQRAAAIGIVSTLYGIVGSTGQEPVLAALSNDGSYTLFAPVNEAFEGLPLPPQEDVINNILYYHVLPMRKVAASFPEGNSSQMTAVTGASVQVERSASGVTVKGGSNPVPATVVAANIQACNGVIHAIDAVLLPSSSK